MNPESKPPTPTASMGSELGTDLRKGIVYTDAPVMMRFLSASETKLENSCKLEKVEITAEAYPHGLKKHLISICGQEEGEQIPAELLISPQDMDKLKLQAGDWIHLDPNAVPMDMTYLTPQFNHADPGHHPKLP